MNNIENLMDILKSNKTREEKLTVELNSRDEINENQINSEYTEVTENLDKSLNIPGGFGLGDFFKFAEITESGRGRKIVYFKSFFTQVNKFRPETKDVVYTFIDREGFQFNSYSFSQIDTSNAKSLPEHLNTLLGNAVIIDYTSLKKGNRVYIETNNVGKCEPLHGQKDQMLMFFRSEVEGKAKIIESINKILDEYPNARKLWNDYFNIFVDIHLDDILNRKGEFISFFLKLLTYVTVSSLDKEEKETILCMELANTLKRGISDYKEFNIELDNKDMEKMIYEEAVFRIYENENEEQEICWGILNMYKDLIYTEMLIKDSKSYNVNRFYNKRIGDYMQIKREEI